MYPLNMTLLVGELTAFAVANDQDEHKTLSEAGYQPPFAGEHDGNGETVESVRAKLDALGIEYDKRLGLSKLIALLPA